MLGIWPTGTRPLGALRGQRIGQVSARLLAAGVSAFAAISVVKANAVVTSAGNASMSVTSFNGWGILTCTATSALVATSATKTSASTTIAGIGATSLKLAAFANAVLSSSCTGVFIPVVRAQASSNTSMQGTSTFGSTDHPGSSFNAGGLGTFTAIGYAFFDDAEKCGPAPELRTAWVPAEYRGPDIISVDAPAEPRTAYAPVENRVAVAPYEDRVYYTKSKPPALGPPNRRRTL